MSRICTPVRLTDAWNWLRSSTYDVGGGRQLLHDNATVGTCLAVLVVGEPRAEALCPVSYRMLRFPGGLAHRVAVCVSARNGVRLVEQAVADLAREMRAQAVEVGLEAVQLLRPVSRALLRGIVLVQRGPDLF
jgi:hypothetical protein